MARSPLDALPSDEELACRAQRGCVASLDRLLRRFQTPMLQYLRHRGAGSDAEDLLQETFLRAYENLHRYSSHWSFSTWLFTIARRISINHHRVVRPKLDDIAVELAPSVAPEPWHTAVCRENRDRLWDIAANTLSEEQTSALWLYYVEGMPVHEIAKVLGRTRGSVKVLLFRARKRLEPLLHELHESVGDAKQVWIARQRRPRIAAMEAPHA